MSKGTHARAIVVGRMGADIEIKTIPGGTRVGNLSLAATSGYGDKAVTSWFNVQVFGDKKIDALSTYSRKGSKVFVDGELRVRKFTKQDGSNGSATEITVGFDGVIEIIADGADGNEPPRQSQSAPPPRDADLDDDVPF